MPKIAVYAGHGGNDFGAAGNGFVEKNLNLAVSNAATAILRSWGYTVLNNRTTDVNRSITADANKANAANVDALVEIHQNASENPTANGSEVFYSIKDTGTGQALAEAVLNRLTALGFSDRGIKTAINANGQDSFGILRLSGMPAVLVESAFITNAQDMANFNADAVGRAVAQGIREIFPIGGSGTSSYPGYALRFGSMGDPVRQIQRCLNNLSQSLGISRMTEDGIFGNATQSAVIVFQRIFGLTADGVVGAITWERLMSECARAGGNGGNNQIPQYPGYALRVGSSGEPVRQIQRCLNNLSQRYGIPRVSEDGIFGNATQSAVIVFQRIFGLTADGVVGAITWERLMSECA
ncbi:MAG: N-acetylmuramoyl-L-alanine amidase, partial [Defluviitaleaceae bacterium]|nr:N-acetylmuramoyl-L-alanine amidase [Defluviitaleaceae bacterium]